jgi:serine/threonine protein kinase/HD superfamily phosphohydrolase YqeK
MNFAQTLDQLVPNARLGHYTIMEHIADGGMGHVYKAYEPGLQREVAIKVLKPELARSEEQISLFEEEATNIAALRHPNIVPIYYIGRQGQLCYFSMAFIQGGSTLDNWIEAGSPLASDQALWVIRQAVDALDCALQQKIVHLDIKPSNFLVDQRGQVLLADFGLARSLAEINKQDRKQDCFGTPAYMCPEQIMNQPTDQRSDIYSLGATIFHLMTTKFLYDADSIEEILMKHLHEPFPYQVAEAAALSPGWINLLDRMTQKKPEDRFQNYQELQDALVNVDRVSPVQIRAAQPKSEVIPVPSKSSEPKEYLYGMLKKGCASWVTTGIDSSCKRTRDQVVELIERPHQPIKLVEFTKALLELQQNVKPEIDDLAGALALSPEMDQFIKGLAQTSLFKSTEAVTDSKSAIQAVGLELSHDLILTMVAIKSQLPKLDEYNLMPLVQHGVSTAIIASRLLDFLDHVPEVKSFSKITSKLMGAIPRAKSSRQAYLCGLMHDIGKFLFCELIPYPFYAAIQLSMQRQVSLEEMEREVLGVDHLEMGGIWCQKHGVDSAVQEVVLHHNNGQHKTSRMCSTIFIANQLAKRHGLGFSGSPIVEMRDFGKTAAWAQVLKNASRKNMAPEQFETEFALIVGELPLIQL